MYILRHLLFVFASTKMFALKILVLMLHYSIVHAELRNIEESIFSGCLTNLIKSNFMIRIIFIENGDSDLHFKDLQTPRMNINENDIQMLEDLEDKYNNFVIQPESTDSLDKTITYLKSTEVFESRGQFLIILKHKKDVNDTAILLWSQGIYKFIIAIENVKGHAEFYAIDLQRFNCGKKITTYKLTTCKNGNVSMKKAAFSKDISENFRNCTLPILWTTEPPLVTHPLDPMEPGIFVSVINLIGKHVKNEDNLLLIAYY